MKIERNHIIIGVLLIAAALLMNQFMVVSPVMYVGQTYNSADASVKAIDVLSNGVSGIIEVKTYCDSSYTRYTLNEGQTITRSCGEVDINVKLKTTFLGTSGTKLMIFEVTKVDNTPINPCLSITCDDYCDGTTEYTSGTCISGECNFNSKLNSVNCGYVPPVNEPPVNEPPVNEPPVDEPPVDEPPVDDEKSNTILISGILVLLIGIIIIIKRK